MINKNYLEDYINNLEKSLYPNITYLIKNELIDFIIKYSNEWKDEIFSKNKDIIENIPLVEFYKLDYAVNELSNNDKFIFFINEF